MSSNSFPKRALLIVGTEACERFSFYGMRSILTLYIVTVLFKEMNRDVAEDVATQIGHLFNMGVYFMPLLGAWIADKFWGRYWTILVMSLFYCAGNAVLALTVGQEWGLGVGLGLIAFGSGGIKPCVSAFMGDQFSKDQTAFLTRAFNMFYWAINFGSFFAFIAIPPIKDAFGYMWAFALPGIFMGLATLIFLTGTRYYNRGLGEWMTMSFKRIAGNVFASAALYGALPGTFFAGLMLLVEQEEIAQFCPLAGTAPLQFLVLAAGTAFLFVFVIFALAAIFARGLCAFVKNNVLAEQKDVPATQETAAPTSLWERFCAIKGILLLFAITPVFWALYDQQSTTWILLGNEMNASDLFGYPINTETIQGLNPVVVMMLIPIFSFLLYPFLNKTRVFAATPLRRMTVGMFLTAASFVICGLLQHTLDAGMQISVWWMALPVVVLTTGEILFSATGLEFAYSQAPSYMRSTITSLWQLTTTVGNFFVVIFIALANDLSNEMRFYFFAGAMAILAILFGIVSIFYKYKNE